MRRWFVGLSPLNKFCVLATPVCLLLTTVMRSCSSPLPPEKTVAVGPRTGSGFHAYVDREKVHQADVENAKSVLRTGIRERAWVVVVGAIQTPTGSPGDLWDTELVNAWGLALMAECQDQRHPDINAFVAAAKRYAAVGDQQRQALLEKMSNLVAPEAAAQGPNTKSLIQQFAAMGFAPQEISKAILEGLKLSQADQRVSLISLIEKDYEGPYAPKELFGQLVASAVQHKDWAVLTRAAGLACTAKWEDVQFPGEALAEVASNAASGGNFELCAWLLHRPGQDAREVAMLACKVMAASLPSAGHVADSKRAGLIKLCSVAGQDPGALQEARKLLIERLRSVNNSPSLWRPELEFDVASGICEPEVLANTAFPPLPTGQPDASAQQRLAGRADDVFFAAGVFKSWNPLTEATLNVFDSCIEQSNVNLFLRLSNDKSVAALTAKEVGKRLSDRIADGKEPYQAMLLLAQVSKNKDFLADNLADRVNKFVERISETQDQPFVELRRLLDIAPKLGLTSENLTRLQAATAIAMRHAGGRRTDSAPATRPLPPILTELSPVVKDLMATSSRDQIPPEGLRTIVLELDRVHAWDQAVTWLSEAEKRNAMQKEKDKELLARLADYSDSVQQVQGWVDREMPALAQKLGEQKENVRFDFTIKKVEGAKIDGTWSFFAQKKDLPLRGEITPEGLVLDVTVAKVPLGQIPFKMKIPLHATATEKDLSYITFGGAEKDYPVRYSKGDDFNLFVLELPPGHRWLQSAFKGSNMLTALQAVETGRMPFDGITFNLEGQPYFNVTEDCREHDMRLIGRICMADGAIQQFRRSRGTGTPAEIVVDNEKTIWKTMITGMQLGAEVDVVVPKGSRQVLLNEGRGAACFWIGLRLVPLKGATSKPATTLPSGSATGSGGKTDKSLQ